MKEKEVHLTLEEIDYLIKGSIHWNDIESRVDAPSRKPIVTNNIKSPLVKSEHEKDPIHKQDQPYRESQSFNQSELNPFLEGNKVYWVLSGVGIATFGVWVYFVFAR